MRFFFLFAGSVIWLGIWLTGFSNAHWLLYVPGVFFLFHRHNRYLSGPHYFISHLIFPGSKTNVAT